MRNYDMALHDVSFLLVPQFSMIALYGAMEPLRVANRFAPDAFSWRFFSTDGEPVVASNGIPVSVSGRLADIGRPAMGVVCASYGHEAGLRGPCWRPSASWRGQRFCWRGWIRDHSFLREAGVLDGYRATCHWESLPGFRESYPAVRHAKRCLKSTGTA
jgi:transcriptional regulator GlxA family with amidase domain